MTLNELQKRIQTLEDIEEIKKLQAHYLNCFNKVRWDDVIDCFVDDAVVDVHAGCARGKAELSKIFKERIGLTHIGQEGNFVVHPIISVEGDKAKGSWLLYLQYAQPRKMKPRPSTLSTDDAPDWMQGYYDMEYKKVDGKWKISMMKMRIRLGSPLALLNKDLMEE
jgi:ketosteroid isomerase-like protein